jgi:hypothetical protein
MKLNALLSVIDWNGFKFLVTISSTSYWNSRDFFLRSLLRSSLLKGFFLSGLMVI